MIRTCSKRLKASSLSRSVYHLLHIHCHNRDSYCYDEHRKIKSNALLNVARTPATDWYSASWGGPPIPSLLPSSQLAALDVFNSMIGLSNDTSSMWVCWRAGNHIADMISLLRSIQTPSPSPTSIVTTGPVPNTRSRNLRLGVIIGITIGALLLTCILVVVIVRLRRNTRTKQRACESIRNSGVVRNLRTPHTGSSTSISPFSSDLLSGILYNFFQG